MRFASRIIAVMIAVIAAVGLGLGTASAQPSPERSGDSFNYRQTGGPGIQCTTYRTKVDFYIYSRPDSRYAIGWVSAGTPIYGAGRYNDFTGGTIYPFAGTKWVPSWNVAIRQGTCY